jgi:hypothetical protein
MSVPALLGESAAETSLGPAQGALGRLRVLPVPDSEPPPLGRPPARAIECGRHVQLRLVVDDHPRAASLPATPVGPDGRPDATEFAGRIAQAVLDVVAGHRPAHQVLRWLRPDVFDTVRRRASLATSGHAVSRRPVVRSLRLCPVHPDAVEVAAVVVDGRRARAMAMRLDAVGSRWRVTALVLG